MQHSFFNMAHRLSEQFQDHIFSPEYRLFRDAVYKFKLDSLEKIDLRGPKWNVQQIANKLNACVTHIRRESQSCKFEAKRFKGHKASRKNQRGGFRWLDKLIASHARLLVIRLDLYYKKEFNLTSGHDYAIRIDDCFDQREQFVRQLPKWIHDDGLLGYMVKTEFKLRRSLHHHVLLILDGSKLRNAIGIGNMIGDRWVNDITGGLGAFNNVNMATDPASPNYAIGDLHYSNVGKIDKLKTKVISYLCKPDYHVQWAISGNHRMFLRSVVKDHMYAVGRPRSIKLN